VTVDTPLSSTTYVAALQAYLQGAGEHALQQAYEIGRTALSAGSSLLTIAQLHHAALATLLQTPSAHERRHVISAAAEFFAECISPYEMTYSGFREANKVLRHFNEVLEQEAKRISHALHDEAGQLLVALYIALENMAQDVPTAREHTVKATALLDQIETQLRRLSHELTPALLNDLGLIPALRYLAEGLTQRAKLTITIECATEQRLPKAVESVLYRITQESLNNVLRHAHASAVSIRIEADHGSAYCRIHDNGVGFNMDAIKARDGEPGFGLIGMRERLTVVGGELHIHSTPEQGTELVVRVPLEH
jgi:signal transduction histidine kinase